MVFASVLAEFWLYLRSKSASDCPLRFSKTLAISSMRKKFWDVLAFKEKTFLRNPAKSVVFG